MSWKIERTVAASLDRAMKLKRVAISVAFALIVIAGSTIAFVTGYFSLAAVIPICVVVSLIAIWGAMPFTPWYAGLVSFSLSSLYLVVMLASWIFFSDPVGFNFEPGSGPWIGGYLVFVAAPLVGLAAVTSLLLAAVRN